MNQKKSNNLNNITLFLLISLLVSIILLIILIIFSNYINYLGINNKNYFFLKKVMNIFSLIIIFICLLNSIVFIIISFRENRTFEYEKYYDYIFVSKKELKKLKNDYELKIKQLTRELKKYK